jgi:hypothetical protein
MCLKHFEIRLIGKVGDDKVRELSAISNWMITCTDLSPYIPHAEITKAQAICPYPDIAIGVKYTGADR